MRAAGPGAEDVVVGSKREVAIIERDRVCDVVADVLPASVGQAANECRG